MTILKRFLVILSLRYHSSQSERQKYVFRRIILVVGITFRAWSSVKWLEIVIFLTDTKKMCVSIQFFQCAWGLALTLSDHRVQSDCAHSHTRTLVQFLELRPSFTNACSDRMWQYFMTFFSLKLPSNFLQRKGYFSILNWVSYNVVFNLNAIVVKRKNSKLIWKPFEVELKYKLKDFRISGDLKSYIHKSIKYIWSKRFLMSLLILWDWALQISSFNRVPFTTNQVLFINQSAYCWDFTEIFPRV